MKEFIAKFGKLLSGVLSGWDRLVIRGELRVRPSRRDAAVLENQWDIAEELPRSRPFHFEGPKGGVVGGGDSRRNLRPLSGEILLDNSVQRIRPDVVFRREEDLRRIYPLMVRHGILHLSSPDALRFLGRKIATGSPVPDQYSEELFSDLKRRQEGVRLKHFAGANSIKAYDKEPPIRFGGRRFRGRPMSAIWTRWRGWMTAPGWRI
jgi:hypothetical protein